MHSATIKRLMCNHHYCLSMCAKKTKNIPRVVSFESSGTLSAHTNRKSALERFGEVSAHAPNRRSREQYKTRKVQVNCYGMLKRHTAKKKMQPFNRQKPGQWMQKCKLNKDAWRMCHALHAHKSFTIQSFKVGASLFRNLAIFMGNIARLSTLWMESDHIECLRSMQTSYMDCDRSNVQWLVRQSDVHNYFHSY